MSSEPSSSSTTSPAADRARGRGNSRGGLGKYLRAKGRRGSGRPAEWGKRLVLEDEEEIDDEEELEAIKEKQKKYARRELTSNADRYVDEEPVLNSDGEEEQEPEVDLSAFLARQKLISPDEPSGPREPNDEEEIDQSLAHLSTSTSQQNRQSKKGQVQSIAWDKDLEELSREKATADANRELKARFRSQATKQEKTRSAVSSTSKWDKRTPTYTEAPPLPTDQELPRKGEREEMQDFLDDLLG